ncbi:MAG: hypothetical protein WD558_00700, partial [Pseudomonadales bacterium]
MHWLTPAGLIAVLLLLASCGGPDVADDSDGKLEVIATGANIAGANGIHFGPDGNLYIASVVGSDITVIDPDTGEEIKRFTRADGVVAPDDVAFAPDGAMYWTSILTGEVAGLTP